MKNATLHNAVKSLNGEIVTVETENGAIQCAQFQSLDGTLHFEDFLHNLGIEPKYELVANVLDSEFLTPLQ